jgi:hypothetical protein
MIVAILLSLSLHQTPGTPSASDSCGKKCQYAITQCLAACKDKEGKKRCEKACRSGEKPCVNGCESRQGQSSP